MKVYEISYDLRAPGRDYSTLHEAIKSYGTWCHPLESTWLVATTATAEAIRDKLRAHVDSNDALLVTKLSGEAAWCGFSSTVNEWLRKQLSQVTTV